MTNPTDSEPPVGDRRSRTRPVTAAYLERAALYYLERFASSTANLRRILMRKVERSVTVHGTDRAEAAQWVEAAITRLKGLGYLDDSSFAETRVASLSRRGRSMAAIRSTLRASGVERDEVDKAVGVLLAEVADPDLDAAAALARRKRLGPYRPPDVRAEMRSKDLAALGRAGFSYDLARRVVDAPTPEDLMTPT